MNPLLFSLLLITYCVNLLNSTHAHANEDIGCLFCHQYPGLVKLDESQHLKILHIDPESYQSSTHGKFGVGCRDCHKDINKIPHVSANNIDCKSSCHDTERDELLLSTQSIKNFHQNQQSIITRLDDQTACKVCHAIYPHSKQPFIRAWLNMHTGYLICESCHLKKDKYTNISYQWLTTKYVEFSGKPFGSYFDPDKKHTQHPESSLSRIVPVIKQRNVVHTLVNTDDTEKARDFLASGSSSTIESQTIAMEYYHRDTSKMDLTTACKNCHTKKGMLNFIELGFTRERADMLINTNIDGIISDYKNFYIPHIFE